MINRACYYYDYNKNYSSHYCMIKKSTIADCEKHCKFFEMVSASPLFVNHMDALFRNASKSPKIDGFENFVMHSTAFYFVSKNANEVEVNVSVEEMAEIIRNFYDGDVPDLRLICCRAGMLDTNDGTAQKLANLLNINVMAARGIVNVDFDGRVTVQDPITGESSDDMTYWKVFKPNNRREDL